MKLSSDPVSHKITNNTITKALTIFLNCSSYI